MLKSIRCGKMCLTALIFGTLLIRATSAAKKKGQSASGTISHCWPYATGGIGIAALSAAIAEHIRIADKNAAKREQAEQDRIQYNKDKSDYENDLASWEAKIKNNEALRKKQDEAKDDVIANNKAAKDQHDEDMEKYKNDIENYKDLKADAETDYKNALEKYEDLKADAKKDYEAALKEHRDEWIDQQVDYKIESIIHDANIMRPSQKWIDDRTQTIRANEERIKGIEKRAGKKYDEMDHQLDENIDPNVGPQPELENYIIDMIGPQPELQDYMPESIEIPVLVEEELPTFTEIVDPARPGDIAEPSDVVDTLPVIGIVGIILGVALVVLALRLFVCLYSSQHSAVITVQLILTSVTLSGVACFQAADVTEAAAEYNMVAGWILAAVTVIAIWALIPCLNRICDSD